MTRTQYILPEDHTIHVSPSGVLYAEKDGKFFPVNGIIADEQEQSFYQYEIDGVRKFYTALGSSPETADRDGRAADNGPGEIAEDSEVKLNDPEQYEEWEGMLTNNEVTGCAFLLAVIFGVIAYGTWQFAKWLFA